MKYHSRYLNDSDFSSLLRFVECCEDSDAGGHDVGKDRMMVFEWRGYTHRTITHPHFGSDPVDVFAIDLSGRIM